MYPYLFQHWQILGGCWVFVWSHVKRMKQKNWSPGVNASRPMHKTWLLMPRNVPPIKTCNYHRYFLKLLLRQGLMYTRLSLNSLNRQGWVWTPDASASTFQDFRLSLPYLVSEYLRVNHRASCLSRKTLFTDYILRLSFSLSFSYLDESRNMSILSIICLLHISKIIWQI